MKQNKAVETLEKLYGVYEAESGIDEAIEIAIKAMKKQKTGEYEPVSEDVMPVIRCKDCKHRDWDVVDIPYGLTKHIEWCSIRYNADGENIMVSPNGFCSEAESKVSSNFE